MKKPDQFRLTASELKPLAIRKNPDAFIRSAAHLGAIAANGALLWNFLGTWWAIPLTVLQGYFVAFMFTIEHEMAHHTAFKTRAFNDLMGHLAGLALVLPYEYYRAFHWDHHRFTNDRARDPELSHPLPASIPGLVWYLTGIPTWLDRIRMLVVHGVLGRVDKPWIPGNKQQLIVLEARVYLLAYAGIIGASIATQSLAALWLWVVPVMVGQPLFLRPYLLAEHTGCPQTPNMLENTRTIYTNAFVRFFAWNMPYHAEHHAYPAVPFHALPKLNKLLADHVVNTERGYGAATVSVMTHIVKEMRG